MGFMDKFKDAAQQAQDAAKAAGGSAASGEIVVNVDPDDPKSMLLWG